MRAVGYKAGLAGMVLLGSLSGAATLARAHAPSSGEIVPFDSWDLPIFDDIEVAEETAPAAAAPAATPPAPMAPAAATQPAATAPAATTPPPTTPPAAASPPAQPPVTGEPPPAEPGAEDVLPDLSAAPTEDFSVGEIPTVEVVELTPDIARKAIDAFAVVHEKYKDAPLENYENLQDFVDQDPQGKAFEADLKSFGFTSANEWNVAVTTVGFAYSNLLDDQTADLRQQIEEVKSDTEMAQDMRDRMIQALSAMIPSDNNRKIVEDMMKDAVYGEKLKLLETEEE